VEENSRPPEKMMNRINEKLAGSLAEVLANAFHELEQHMMDEGRKLTQSIPAPNRQAANHSRKLSALKVTLEELRRPFPSTRRPAHLKEQYSKLAAEVAQLQKADGQQNADIADIRNKTLQMSSDVNRHQGELASLKAAVFRKVGENRFP